MMQPGKKIGRPFCAAILSATLLFACKKTDTGTGDTTPAVDPLAALNLPATPFNYANQPLPGFFNAPNVTGTDNTPPGNPVTDWGATLGRVLFYDNILSINKTVSCASCHKQSLGFNDDLRLSLGFAGGQTGRNSMSLLNARYYPNGRFFWDERAATLEQQVLIPVQDHIEMGMNLDTLINRAKATAHYPYLFQKVFGDNTITSDRIARTLAQFVRSMISYQSKFDQGLALLPPGSNPATPFPNYTAQENQGKDVFQNPVNACAACHGTATFTAPEARNNGLDLTSADRGLGAVTGNTPDNGRFKVPSLKNIELTAPYMRDGRFTTLEQVVEHYNSGIQAHPNLSAPLRNPNGTPKRLNLTQAEKDALVAFMRTLTDRAITTDVKFSNPFK